MARFLDWLSVWRLQRLYRKCPELYEADRYIFHGGGGGFEG